MDYQYEAEYHGQRMNAEQAKERLFVEKMRPFYLLRPKVFADGDQWCVLYGENIQVGICGFGVTPERASIAFDIAWLNERV
jgi:hypothetical protein